MLPITEAPQHVLYPVRGVEQHEEQPFSATIKLEAHGVYTLAEHQLTVLQIGGLIEAAIVQAIVIFRHPQRRKQANLVG